MKQELSAKWNNMCTWKQINSKYWAVNAQNVTGKSHKLIIVFGKVYKVSRATIENFHCHKYNLTPALIQQEKCDCGLMDRCEEGDDHTQEDEMKGFRWVRGCLAWSHGGCHLDDTQRMFFRLKAGLNSGHVHWPSWCHLTASMVY